ncbi:Protein kinase domain-containing protein [Psidium guajava]|nr:Protein kinase domain-containing protein [Psidium guajava]
MDHSDEMLSSSNSSGGKALGQLQQRPVLLVYDESKTSYDLEKLLYGAVFSEIMNPNAL